MKDTGSSSWTKCRRWISSWSVVRSKTWWASVPGHHTKCGREWYRSEGYAPNRNKPIFFTTVWRCPVVFSRRYCWVGIFNCHKQSGNLSFVTISVKKYTTEFTVSLCSGLKSLRLINILEFNVLILAIITFVITTTRCGVTTTSMSKFMEKYYIWW